MRIWLILSMLVPAAAVLAIMFLQHAQLRRFQRRVPELRTADDLAAFTRLAGTQMYWSLAGLTLTGVPPMVWLFGKFVAGQLGWLDALLYVVLPFAALTYASGRLVSTARAVRATPADDPALTAERDRVVHVWLHRNLPDW